MCVCVCVWVCVCVCEDVCVLRCCDYFICSVCYNLYLGFALEGALRAGVQCAHSATPLPGRILSIFANSHSFEHRGHTERVFSQRWMQSK